MSYQSIPPQFPARAHPTPLDPPRETTPTPVRRWPWLGLGFVLGTVVGAPLLFIWFLWALSQMSF